MSLAIALTSSFLSRTDLDHDQRLPIQWERIACLRISGQMDKARAEIQKTLKIVEEQEKQIQQEQTGEISGGVVQEESLEEIKKKQGLVEANGLLNLGILEYQKSNFSDSLSLLHKSLALYERYEDAAGQARAKLNLGNVYKYSGKSDKALELHHQALELFKRSGNEVSSARVLGNIANFYQKAGKYEQALAYQQQVLEIMQKNDDQREEGRVLGNMSITYAELGRYEEALECHQRALLLQRSFGDLRSEGITLGNIGLVYYAQEKYEEALDYYTKALEITDQTKNKRDGGIFIGNIGNIYVQMGCWKEAQPILQQAIDICCDKTPPACGAFRGTLALVYAHEGDLKSAFEQLHIGEPEVQTIPIEYGKFLCKKGRVELYANRIQQAAKSLHQAQQIALQLKIKAESELAKSIAKLESLLNGAKGEAG